MANKLPWFTHDHDAHDDEFIQASMDRFGPAGYSNYFITLELLHKHGVGDVLIMRAGRLAKCLRSRMDSVKKWLSFCGSFRDQSGINPKIISTFIQTDSGEDVRIEIKKFRERQAKIKIKTPATLSQDSTKTPLEREGEEEKQTNSGIRTFIKSDPSLGVYSAPFLAFWDAYPICQHKGSKVAAVEAWDSVQPSGAVLDAIMDGLEQHKALEKWTKDNGDFIPSAQKWLRERHWENEVAEDRDRTSAPALPHQCVRCGIVHPWTEVCP